MQQSSLETRPAAGVASTAGDESSLEVYRTAAVDSLMFLPRTSAFHARSGGFFFERNLCGSYETASTSWDLGPSDENYR
jgi:hypothetical protein